jgi:hypothetical protein
MEGLNWVVYIFIGFVFFSAIHWYQTRHLRSYETFVSLLSSSNEGQIERGEMSAFKDALKHCGKEAAFGRIHSDTGRQSYVIVERKQHFEK